MLSSSNIRNSVFDQSSSVQPITEYRGGPLSVTYIHSSSSRSSRTVLLLSNIGYHNTPKLISYHCYSYQGWRTFTWRFSAPRGNPPLLTGLQHPEAQDGSTIPLFQGLKEQERLGPGWWCGGHRGSGPGGIPHLALRKGCQKKSKCKLLPKGGGSTPKFT